MINNFTYLQPRVIEFGLGARSTLPGLLECCEAGRRVLLLSGRRWFEESGWRRRFSDLLADFQVSVLTCPPGEPTCEGIPPLLTAAEEIAPDVIVAVGGGSVLDTAKTISALLGRDHGVEAYLETVSAEPRSLEGPGVPWIAVPTTAGTGAEVTKNAVLRSLSLGLKRSFRSQELVAARVVVDPELALGSPRGLTGTSGLDALIQLVESYVSRKAQPIPRALVLNAFPVLMAALKDLAADLNDPQARTGAAYGALASGLALANSGLGAAHGFASGLGGMFDIPHGLICALFMPAVLRANADLIAADCARLCREAGCPVEEDAVEWLSREIENLIDLYDLPRNLKSFGIPADKVMEIARRSSGSSMSGNPRELGPDERAEMIRGLL
jgi:alcohol dehydrogenase class IV